MSNTRQRLATALRMSGRLQPVALACLAFLVCQYAVAAPLDDAAKRYQTIRVERQGLIVIGRFDNPPRHVMNPTMVGELKNLLMHVDSDEQSRVLILTGAAPNVFIAHYDTQEIGRKGAQATTEGEISPQGELPTLHEMHKALLAIETLSKPVIAAINGRAHGGGFETALACDFRFISKNGSVGLPEVNLGIIPGGGGTQRLPRLIGRGKARELIMLGTSVDGETAERLGLVTRAVEPEQLIAEALAFANQLAAKPAISLQQIKRALHEGADASLEQALIIEQDAYYKASRSSETRALFRARGLAK